jgi:hypothetical protein
VRLEAFEVDQDGSRQPIPLAQIGLPDRIPVTGPTTTHTWIARGWPDPEESDPHAEIVVRLTDQTAESPPLIVTPDPWTPIETAGMPGGTPGVAERGRAPAPVGFRALSRSPLPGTALLVELAEAAAVRLELFDLAGRRVRSLADRTLPAGPTVIAWDGREESGARARPGVYFARLATAAGDRTARVLLAP